MERKTGRLHPLRGGEAELDSKFVWLREAFFWLNMRRPYTMGTPLLIPYSEMVTYAKYKLELDNETTKYFIEIMEQLDIVWSEVKGNKSSAKPVATS